MRRKMIAIGITVTTAVATAMTAGGLASPASAAVGSSDVAGSVPTWTVHAQSLGRASAGASASGRVYLAPRGGIANLTKLATAMSTPGSASYRKFLTRSQYVASYQPTAGSVSAVEQLLRSGGLAVTSVGASNSYVAFSGTVGAAEKTFGTQIQRYNRSGQSVQAPSSALKVPATLASTVLTVTGLDSTSHLATPASAPAAPPPAGFRNARPCSIFFGQVAAKFQADFSTPLPKFNGKTLAYAPCGYTGPQFRAAYEGSTSLDGSGVTVAVVDAYAAPTIVSDTNKYASQNGDGSYAPGQLKQVKASKFTHQLLCGPSGWYGEETLDVEAVHAMAPGANIRYYGAASCEDTDLVDALAQVVIDDKAQLVTNSWGEPAEGETADSVAAFESVFLAGTVEGISFMFSSGDSGDELANTGIKQADYPTSDPFVTSVGGTSTAIDGNGVLAWEAGWGTEKYGLSGSSWALTVPFLYGAGGGMSTLFQKPAYQVGTSPGAYRGVPDVAMDADPNTGMLIGETQIFPDGTYYDQYRIGGTSLASPLFAGMTALTLESAGSAAGLLNPVIYGSQSAFTDVKGTPKQAGDVRVDFANGVDGSSGLLYSVRTFGQDSSLAVTKGWDQVTGVGSPTSAWLSALG
jgi:subtilase family serine protease